MPGLSAADRRTYAKGLGWLLRDKRELAVHGQPGLAAGLRSLRSHRLWGLWRTRRPGLSCAIFTNKSHTDGSIMYELTAISNAVAAAVVE